MHKLKGCILNTVTTATISKLQQYAHSIPREKLLHRVKVKYCTQALPPTNVLQCV